jgi:hypothetical protein
LPDGERKAGEVKWMIDRVSTFIALSGEADRLV